MVEQALVEAHSVVKRWVRTEALRGVSFAIGPGVTGLVGANGAGKTTLFGMMLGLHPPDSGQMRVLGLDPTTHGMRLRARIGYAPEHDVLPADVSAHEIVCHLAELHGLPRRAATERASDVLYEVGLGEERFRHVGTFSTGQRQRAKLAQAIAHDPELVLLDEPTNGLDPVQREDMLRLIRKVSARLGIHVVISSHLLDEIERVADAVVILDAGAVIASGPLSSLRAMGEAEVRVELDGTPEHAYLLVGSLTERGVAAVVQDDASVLVAVESPIVHDILRDAVADLQLPLRRVARRSASLEDVFFAAGGAR